MTAPDTPNAVKEHLLQDSDSGAYRKPHLTAANSEIPSHGLLLHKQPGKGGAFYAQYPKKRYWMRTLVLILIPSVITAWYGYIWIELVLGTESDDAVKFRTFSGSLIYYSWFIIGVFGLSWSQFGLAGVEVAMLESPFWRARNLVALLSHSNETWSSPSGWMKVFYHREFNRLWCLLMLLTLLPFIAFPLSGLVFEISDGYIVVNKSPMVVGRNVSNFNDVFMYENGLTYPSWVAGSTPAIPGYGVLYTPEGFDRSSHPCLSRTPNTLPLTEAIPDMFLAPQADVPVSGKTWGLRVKYDCSLVRKASEFTILSQKPESRVQFIGEFDEGRKLVRLGTPSGDFIHIYNSTTRGTKVEGNIWAHFEQGVSHLYNDRDKYDGNQTDFAKDDESNSMVMELVVWQIQYPSHYDPDYTDDNGASWPFNRTLDPVIEGMTNPFLAADDGSIRYNEDYFRIRGGDIESDVSPFDNIRNLHELFDAPDAKAPLDIGGPVGVRCVVSSGLGTSVLNGVSSTFSDFERVDPVQVNNSEAGRPVFGHVGQNTITHGAFRNLYRVAHLPPKVPDFNYHKYQRYVPPQALLHATLLAYGTNALELMYDVVPHDDSAWLHPELRSSRQGKILDIASLIPGHATGYFVLALFCLWSGLSVVLGVVYGFRKRGSDKLDGYSMFCRGAEMSDEIKDTGGAMSREDSFYRNQTFHAMPGT